MSELITFDDGKCDFYANGFDCRDCALQYTCEHSEYTESEDEE